MNIFKYLILPISLFWWGCEQVKHEPLKQSKGIIKFISTTHDFGNMNEYDNPITYKFVFSNIGTEPVFIKNVNASCGCTSPNWSKNEILPGDSGFVEATYTPRGHPGAFNKSLIVYSNTIDSITGLFIAGNVIKHVKTIEELYKDTLGNIRINSKYISLGTINNKEKALNEYKIYNSSYNSITFNSTVKTPSYLKIIFDPKILESEKEGTLKIIFDPKTKNEVGNFSDEIIVNTNDNKSPKKSFFVSGTITEYFPQLTEQELLSSPKLIRDKTIHDFGKIKRGTKISTEFFVKNVGEQDLKIRKLEPSCYCTSAQIDNLNIIPNQQGTIKVIYDTHDLSLGPDTKSIKMYCNDPLNPTSYFIINATITE